MEKTAVSVHDMRRAGESPLAAVRPAVRHVRGERLLPGGIRARLLLLIALALLPMLLLLGWIYHQHYRNHRALALQAELEVAQGVATTFAAYVEGVRQQLTVIGQVVITSSPYSAPRVERLLRDAAAGYPAVRSLNWVSPGGTTLVSSLPGAAGSDLSARPYFRRIAAGEPWAIGDLTSRSVVVDAPTVGIAAAVRDAGGTLRGVMVAGFEPTRLGELTFSQRHLDAGVYALFDRKGHLVYQSSGRPLSWEDRERWLEGDPVLARVLRTGEAQVGPSGHATPGGESISARVPLPGIGWVAGAQRPMDVVFAPVWRGLRQDSLLALPVLLLAFLLAFLLSQTIAGPLRLLEEDARLMGESGEVRAAPPPAPTEVSRLRETVTKMALDLTRRADEIRSLNETLERRVLERTADLEAANREMEAFSYSVSHDLRAPLRSVDGFSQLLLERHLERLDGQARNYLARVRAAAQRMGRLIDDMLTLSRIGRRELRQETVDLSALAAAAAGELRQREPERKVRLEIGPGLRAGGDAALLRIVLDNLLGNAWKFSAGREEASIAVGAMERDGETAYFVRDNGAGFSMSYADKLFKPFQRLHTEREFPGNGIGLAIVQRIVSRHGGRVWAEGAEGEGATLYFTLGGKPS